ncbi:uncharacterized protein EV420DRAFT_1540863, partial [Desarmillaria tabescens]
EIEEVIGPLTDEQFSWLVSLSMKSTDYSGRGQSKAMFDSNMEQKDVEIDDEVGVAVIFDEEEREDEDEDEFEIRGESDDDGKEEGRRGCT